MPIGQDLVRPPSQAKAQLEALVARYYDYTAQVLSTWSEANVRANFIDPLFAALGWPVDDPAYYDREVYVRGVGFADVGLSVDPGSDVVLLVEAKRFGALLPLDQVQKHSRGLVNSMSEAAAARPLTMPGMPVDRTREEQQAINYAYEKGVRWAVLTNFEYLRLFDAVRDTLVLSFESPRELLARFDELWVLAYEEVRRGRLATLHAHRERADIDAEYLALINAWRLRLGRDIYGRAGNRALLIDPATGEVDVYKLRDVVQRILDRFVVIRYAEDRLVIPPDQLYSLAEVRRRVQYVSLLEIIRSFFNGFNVHHNGTLFADHLCDRLEIDDSVLIAVIENLYTARFRAMSPDIMGNTYEQYLGQTLVIERGDVAIADNVETRKAQGSYYTPEYVVQYIVDHTLGRLLYGTENGRPDGPPLPGASRKTLADIDGTHGSPLTLVDPASGSGSFLIYAYQVLAAFYEEEIARLQAMRDAKAEALIAQGLMPMDIRIELADMDRRLEALQDYGNHILERHIYGVDLDPQAAELAAVNLMLRALKRGWRLPLILDQNIKVGNSLISGVPPRPPESGESDPLAPYAAQLAELRRLRLAQQGAAGEVERVVGLQEKIATLRADVNAALNASLAEYFDDDDGAVARHPFNWPVAFPEVFLDEEGHWREDGGFDVVIGNPPYLNIDAVWGQGALEAGYLKARYAEIWAGKSDYFYYFMRLGLALLKAGGSMGMITARYYLEAYYATNLRAVMLEEATLLQIVDFGDYAVFPDVGTKTCITLVRRARAPGQCRDHQVQFARVPDKGADISDFLDTFNERAIVFPQANLDGDSWNFFGRDVARVIDRIDEKSVLLGDIAFIGKGMETGRNGVFVVDAEALRRYKIEPALVRKVVKNQDIMPYALNFRGLYVIYPEDVETLADYPHTHAYLAAHRETLEKRAAFKRGDCEWYRFTWPLHKEHYDSLKLMVPYIAPYNRFALDAEAEFIGLTDTTVIFPTEDSPDLRYLLALLNAKLLNFRYRYIGKPKDYRYEYFENGLAKIPIRLPGETPMADDSLSQMLIALAQTMLDLNCTLSVVAAVFADCLMAQEHVRRTFYEAYIDHDQYQRQPIVRAGPIDANAQGTVTAVRVAEAEDRLCISITLDEDNFPSPHRGGLEGGTTVAARPLAAWQITPLALRRFLLLALRADLAAKQRKRIWSRGRIVRGTLSALEVPVLNETSAEANIAGITALLAEVRARVAGRLADVLGDRLAFITDPLDISALERHLAETRRRIDTLVYKRYGLTPDEIAVVERVLSKGS